MAKHLFGDSITPACEYCENGSRSKDGTMIDCKKKGVVSPYFRCKRFKYNPIKRVPKLSPRMTKLSAEDFVL